MTTKRAAPVALTIAGSDCSAGAGAQADLKTFSALGVYGLTAMTCVVAETPGKVQRVQAMDAEMVAEQIALLLANFPVAAIKTGMLFSGEIVATVARVLREVHVPLVVDPVMVATSGDLLLHPDAIEIYERELFPLATLLTPNLDEAATLFGRAVSDLDTMREAGQQLAARYGVSILLKGGHLRGEEAIDLLCTANEVREFSAPFEHRVQTHGTGCTYSAAIAAGLAAGAPLAEAIERAKRFVTAAIRQHFAWPTGNERALHALNHLPNES